MSLQERLDAFKKNFESGGPPYNVHQEAIDSMHLATADGVALFGDHGA